MTCQPILVFPTLHYQNGGIAIDPDGRTDVPGLFATGEVSEWEHGKNRLMGNSLLDYNVLGRRAGRSAAWDILADIGPGAALTPDRAYCHTRRTGKPVSKTKAAARCCCQTIVGRRRCRGG